MASCTASLANREGSGNVRDAARLSLAPRERIITSPVSGVTWSNPLSSNFVIWKFRAACPRLPRSSLSISLRAERRKRGLSSGAISRDAISGWTSGRTTARSQIRERAFSAGQWTGDFSVYGNQEGFKIKWVHGRRLNGFSRATIRFNSFRCIGGSAIPHSFARNIPSRVLTTVSSRASTSDLNSISRWRCVLVSKTICTGLPRDFPSRGILIHAMVMFHLRARPIAWSRWRNDHDAANDSKRDSKRRSPCKQFLKAHGWN